jgi:hypothetical protein
MSDRTVRCYAYVNRPYESVRTALSEQPVDLLRKATVSANGRAHEIAANLKVTAAGVEIGVDVRVHVTSVREDEGIAGFSPVTRVSLTWEAARHTSLFPLMAAEIAAWPLSATETQLEIEGAYQPPLGVLGSAIEDVVEQLRRM